MKRIVQDVPLEFAEAELLCTKCLRPILKALSLAFAPISLQHSPVQCNPDGSHTLAPWEIHGELTFIALDRAESKYGKKPAFKSEYASYTGNEGTQQPPTSAEPKKE